MVSFAGPEIASRVRVRATEVRQDVPEGVRLRLRATEMGTHQDPAYAEDFMKTYAVANNKPSERAAKARMLEHQLLPAFGTTRDCVRAR